MSLDLPTLNNALLGSSGGSGVVGTLANFATNRRAMELQDRQYGQALDYNREALRLNDALARDRMGYEAENADKQRDHAKEIRLAELDQDTQVRLAEAEADIQVAKEQNIAARMRAKADQDRAKGELSERQWKIIKEKEDRASAKADKRLKPHFDFIKNNIGNPQALGTFEGIRAMAILAQGKPVIDALGVRPHMQENSDIIPDFYANPGYVSWFVLDKEGNKKPITEGGVPYDEGGKPVLQNIPLDDVARMMSNLYSGKYSPGLQDKRALVEAEGKLNPTTSERLLQLEAPSKQKAIFEAQQGVPQAQAQADRAAASNTEVQQAVAQQNTLRDNEIAERVHPVTLDNAVPLARAKASVATNTAEMAANEIKDKLSSQQIDQFESRMESIWKKRMKPFEGVLDGNNVFKQLFNTTPFEGGTGRNGALPDQPEEATRMGWEVMSELQQKGLVPYNPNNITAEHMDLVVAEVEKRYTDVINQFNQRKQGAGGSSILNNERAQGTRRRLDELSGR